MAVTLPDVGAGMDKGVTFEQRFYSSPEQGGVVADRWAQTCALAWDARRRGRTQLHA